MLDSKLKSVFTLKEFSDRKPEIRPSGMPFCPRRFIFSCLETLNNGSEWDFCGDFYCSIGTAIHEALQKWLPKVNKGAILGNWECSKCKSNNNYKPLLALVGPQNCPICGKDMDYVEFELPFLGTPMIGHCDGVILDLDFIEKRYKIKKDDENIINKINILIRKNLKDKIPGYILEYKSTGVYSVKSISEPQHKHTLQATTYVSASRKCLPKLFGLHGIDMQGYIIKYISRDNPRQISRDFKCKIDNDRLYNNTCKIVNRIFKMLSDPNEKTIKPCYDLWCCRQFPSVFGECDYASICEDEFSLEDFTRDVMFVYNTIGNHFIIKKTKLF